MPYSIGNLTSGRGRPVSVSADHPLRSAIEVMIEHDYSQLPVIDENEKPLGLITNDSILRAVERFNTPIDALQVMHAKVKVPKFRPDEDLFDVLNASREEYAVLIVDADDRLTGIVTSYDTAEYFRRQAEDLMLVEDIENDLKDHIRAAYTTGNGEVDEDALSTAISDLTQSKQNNQKWFSSALGRYLSLAGEKKVSVRPNLVAQVLAQQTDSTVTISALDDLTLSDYINLLLHKDQYCESVFNLNSKSVLNVLESVRETRNALAHFREVTPKQRYHLSFCINWLSEHRPRISSTAGLDAPDMEKDEAGKAHGQIPARVEGLSPIEEVLGPDDSRYARLALYLRAQDIQSDVINFTFNQIEDLIGDRLPATARKHRSWWENDEQSHPQSKQWLEVGWRVVSVDMGTGTVVFARSEKRRQAYIAFFTSLLTELAEIADFQLATREPDGQNWILVALLSELQGAGLFFSFARSNRFRVELYVDTGSAEKNKQVFDTLRERRDRIEAAIGESLDWERMDDQRACRIALYHNGAITDSEEELRQLRQWAKERMLRFQSAICQEFDRTLY